MAGGGRTGVASARALPLALFAHVDRVIARALEGGAAELSPPHVVAAGYA